MAFTPCGDRGLSGGALESSDCVGTLDSSQNVVELNVLDDQAPSSWGLGSRVVGGQETDLGIGDRGVDEDDRADTLAGATSVAHIETSCAVIDGD